MEPLIPRLAQLFDETLSSDDAVVSSATESLEGLSVLPELPFSLVSIATGGENQGQRIAAATYLKNFTGRRIGGDNPSSKVSKEFRTCLLGALLQVEPAVLKVLVEAFRIIVVAEFVKENSWPELIFELRSVIQNSNLISEGANLRWNTINGLIVLQAVIRPFQLPDLKLPSAAELAPVDEGPSSQTGDTDQQFDNPMISDLQRREELDSRLSAHYFLDPKLVKEPVPPQLELIAKEILVPLLTIFHHSVDKVLSIEGAEMETERILLIICKCMYFAVRSHMPSALVPLLPTFCRNLFRVLDSLVFDGTTTSSEGCLLRLKTGKRSLLIFFALVTRHRKHSDKLMPNMINSVFRIVKQSCNTTKLDFLSERIISLAFDVISHIMETGAGWRLVSPHFSSLLSSAIFPALVMNEKDVAEWEEDGDEYIRKNLPSDLEEISGWKEDLFTARKSAINLLGVISMSKGPPVIASSSKRKKSDKKKGKEQYNSVGELLVLPFLSQFPIPSAVGSGQTKISNDYYGVLMAYGSLQDFLREQNPGYTTSLVQTRVLPLYTLSPSLPYLVATANWVLGVLASCLSQEMSADIYSSLLKALTMPDFGDTSCYPVRVSAAGAIAELLENDYPPPEWLPLLQVVVSRVDNDDENESSILFQLLSTVAEAGNGNVAVHIPSIVSPVIGAVLKFIPPNPEPWPQVVEQGFAALAVMAKTWEDYVAEQIEQDESSSNWQSGSVSMAKTFSVLLQQAWLTSMQPKEGVSHALPPSCVNDASTILRAIMRSLMDPSLVLELKISDLLVAWSDLIAEWHAWEELEDLSIFDSIQEVVNLHKKCELKNFIVRGHPSPPAPPVPERSIVEGIGAFVSEAISQYPSAIWRACSCVHVLLHVLSFSYETEGVKQSLVITLSRAAFSRFRMIRSKPGALWKPLLLAISSCYLCYPDIVERILEKDEDKGFTVWASALSYISTSSFEPGLSDESEIKLIVMTITKVVERLLERAGDPWSGLLQDCFASLVEATIRLKEVQEEEDEDDGEDEDADVETDDDDDDDDDEDSEDEREETEEEFLNRYAEAAVALENGMIVEEGDVEDQDQELELGVLGDIDPQRAVLSLMERYNQVLQQKLPPQLVTGFVNTFPEYASFFPAISVTL